MRSMSDVQNVKSAVDVVDVVGRYVDLRPSGSSFKARCPFHEERTPSFMVWPDRQFWKCFGCGESGDVISFVSKVENMDFPTALRRLAEIGGVELRSRSSQQRPDPNEALYGLMAQAAAFFRRNLLDRGDGDAIKAREYLSTRRISAEMAEAFEIGLSRWQRTGLLDFMQEQEFSKEDLTTVNLVIEQENGAWRDRFMGLLMLPIRNARGRVVGFGARQLPPETKRFGKYMNTAATPLFDKSRQLYGIDKARNAIRREGQAVIVEGYFDVIAAHQHGHANTVACMGTAVTPGHVQELQKLTSRITFALDADAAGQQATIRNLDRSRQALRMANQEERRRTGASEELQMTIVKLPPGQDPDELIRADADAWPTLVRNSMSLVDFYIDHLEAEYDFSSPEEKQKAVRRIADVLAEFQQPVTRQGYIEIAARRMQIGQSLLIRTVQEAGKRSRHSQSQRSSDAGTSSVRQPKKEDRLLSAICLHPRMVLERMREDLESLNLEDLTSRDFGNSENATVYSAVTELEEVSQETALDDLRHVLDGSLWPHLDFLQAVAQSLQYNDSRELSQAALEHLLEMRRRSVNSNLELLNIGQDTSSLEGARETQEHRQTLYASRRSLDEARDKLQMQMVSD